MTARPDGPGQTPEDGDRASDADLAERWKAIVDELGELDHAADATHLLDPAGTTESVESTDPAAATGPAATYPVAPWLAGRSPEEGRLDLSGRDWDGTDQIDAAEAELEDREHFVPPDPGPIFGGEPLLTLAWLGVAGIPIALVIVIIAWRSAPLIFLQVAGVVFALCCFVLIWRMPHQRDAADDDPGAVV